MMYNILKKMYDENKLSDAGLKKALDVGWLTLEEYEQIKGKQN